MNRKIAIVGAGNVGATLGRRWAAAGHDVVFGLRSGSEVKGGMPEGARGAPVAEAAQAADVVVLAVPASAVHDALAEAGPLDGKVVVDATNAVARDARGNVVAGGAEAARSDAERLADAAPGARVVKAFNTVGYNIMADPVLDGRATVMPIAGDDAAAKHVVAELASALGFEPLDAGPLVRARELEHLAILWISLAFSGMGRDFAFGLLRRSSGSAG